MQILLRLVRKSKGLRGVRRSCIGTESEHVAYIVERDLEKGNTWILGKDSGGCSVLEFTF